MGTNDSNWEDIIGKAALERYEEIRALRAERDAKPFHAPEFEQCFKSTYDLCVTPLEALEAMNLSTRSLAVTQLHRELKSDRLKAVCEESIRLVDGEAKRQKYGVIAPWLWSAALPTPENDFWETGYLHVTIPSNVGQTMWNGQVELFGVRFSRVNLPGRQDEAPEEIGSEVTRPQASRADLEKFCRAMLSEWPDMTQDVAYEKAQLFYPDKRIARDNFRSILRSIRGDTKPGKKPKMDD